MSWVPAQYGQTFQSEPQYPIKPVIVEHTRNQHFEGRGRRVRSLMPLAVYLKSKSSLGYMNPS